MIILMPGDISLSMLQNLLTSNLGMIKILLAMDTAVCS